MAKVSPTQRTLKLLRSEGYLAYVVEQTIPYSFIKRDLAGFGDILAWSRSRTHLIVQTTSAANVSSRVKKIKTNAAAASWLDSGGAIEVHGWGKFGPRGKAKRWAVRRVRMAFKDGAVEILWSVVD